MAWATWESWAFSTSSKPMEGLLTTSLIDLGAWEVSELVMARERMRTAWLN
jgi:hypothetical protein